MNTPILFLIFNRPDTTQKIFDVIRQVKPKKLFVAGDGPRSNKVGEKEKCEEARKIITQIDWNCEVKTLFRDENLGCGVAVSEAITWFFKNVEEGIILEDDCLPNISFFKYCEDLLEKYRYEEKVMHIGGSNFLFNKIKIEEDYYFSRIPLIWGWATWRRAWEKYDFKMKSWPLDKSFLKKIFNNYFFIESYSRSFNKVYAGKIDTWDYQWTYCVLKNNAFCINPRVNLISNIGFSKGATHTKKRNKISDLKTENLYIEDYVDVLGYNNRADNFMLKDIFNHSFMSEIKILIKKIIFYQYFINKINR